MVDYKDYDKKSYHAGFQDGYAEGHVDGVLQGEKLYAPKLGKWIPVSEKLPENGNRVIVTNKDGQVFISSFWEHFRFFDDEIIAWQPLPEPYKEGGAE